MLFYITLLIPGKWIWKRFNAAWTLFRCPCHHYFLLSFLCVDCPVCFSHELDLYSCLFTLRPWLFTSPWDGIWLFGGRLLKCTLVVGGRGRSEAAGEEAPSGLCFPWEQLGGFNVQETSPRSASWGTSASGPVSCIMRICSLLQSGEIIFVLPTPSLLRKMGTGKWRAALFHIPMSHSLFFTDSMMKTWPYFPSLRVFRAYGKAAC